MLSALPDTPGPAVAQQVDSLGLMLSPADDKEDGAEDTAIRARQV
jgi:hypothetical protein